MLDSFRTWLNTTALTDPTERRQAPILQVLLIGFITLLVLIFPILVLIAQTPWRVIFDTISCIVFILFFGTAIVLLRRGHFSTAVLVTALGFMPGQVISLTTTGVDNSATMFVYAIAIALVGLLARRRALVLVVIISIITIIGSMLVAPYVQAALGFTPQKLQLRAIAGFFCMMLILLAAFLDQFASIFREALTLSHARERELEAVRASLEITVGERTAQLQQALQAVEQREAHLVQTLNELQASQAMIRELSAPILPVLDGVLVAPLIGAVDGERALALTENVLHTVEQTHAHHVIFDITGVAVVDMHVAQVLIRAAESVQLLGAKAVVVGIRPEVAQTLVALSIQFRSLSTYASLQEAIAMLQHEHQRRKGNGRVVLNPI